MSTASVIEVQPASPMLRPASQLRHWLRLFRSELRIVFLRPRNLAMLAVLAAAPIFLGIVLKINTPPPGVGRALRAPGSSSGRSPRTACSCRCSSIFVLMTLVLPLSVAVVSGDSVAGEAGLGTLQDAAHRSGRPGQAAGHQVPDDRRVLLRGLCAGRRHRAGRWARLLFPIGPVTLLSGETVPLIDGLARLAMIVVYVAVRADGARRARPGAFHVHRSTRSR